MIWIDQQKKMHLTQRSKTTEYSGQRTGTNPGAGEEKQMVLTGAEEQQPGDTKTEGHIVKLYRGHNIHC